MTDNSPLKKALDAAAVSAFAMFCASALAVRSSILPSARAFGVSTIPFEPGFFGMTSGGWTVIHDATFTLLLVLLLPNLFWGWSWLAGWFGPAKEPRSATRAALGLVAAITLVASFFTGFRSTLPSGFIPAPGNAVPLLGEDSDAIIATLSLAEAEKRLGVPLEFLRSNLRLPANVSTSEPFSELMKKYPFGINDVRQVALAHLADQQISAPELQQN